MSVIFVDPFSSEQCEMGRGRDEFDKTSPVCVRVSKNNRRVFVFKHTHRAVQLELVFRSEMFAQQTECFSEESFSSVPWSQSTGFSWINVEHWAQWNDCLNTDPSLLFSSLHVSPSLLILLMPLSPLFLLSPSFHFLRYAVPTMKPTRSFRSSSSRCGTRWLTWRAVCCPRPCCSTGAGWAQRTFWYPSFKSRSSLFVRLPVWLSTGGTNPCL